MSNNKYNSEISGDSRLSLLPQDFDLSTILEVTTELPAGSVELGYFHTDGESLNREISTTAIKAHQNQDVIREVVTDESITLNVTSVESTPVTRGLYFSAVEDASGVIDLNTSNLQEHKVVYESFDTAPGYIKVTRVVGVATVTPTGSIDFTATDVVGYPFQFKFDKSTTRVMSSPVPAETPED